ncbi:hypothetical protein K1X84_02910 [bacterium]|nr:hypothetical protein [bacterium]
MIKKFFFVIMAIVLSLTLIEIVLQALVVIKHGWENGPINPRIYLSPYKDKSWAKSMFNEIRETELEYQPYLDSRTRPFHGQNINIDSLGFRKTWNESLFEDTLLIFGGSTIWGYGARDSKTIPSLLSQKIVTKGFKITTLNCGEQSYNFTQEIIRLIFLLRDGYRPKYVIFYDGANDVFLTYYYNQPGKTAFTHHFQDWIDFRKRSFFSQIGFISWEWITMHSKIYKGISLLLNLDVIKKDSSPFDSIQLTALALSYKDYYKKNFLFLQQLSKVYQFKLICFWQPVIQTKKTLTDEERLVKQPVMDDPDGQLYPMINQLMTTDSSLHFYNISNIFDENPTTVFIDNIHITEEGNQIVADKIFEIIYPILNKNIHY